MDDNRSGFVAASIFLSERGFSPQRIPPILKKLMNDYSIADSQLPEYVNQLYINRAIEPDRGMELTPQLPEDITLDQCAIDVQRFLWYPYIPLNEYTVLYASGGTGKGFFIAALCSALTTGRALPAQAEKPAVDVLIVSSEETGGRLRDRFGTSGADLSRCHVIDKETVSALSLSDNPLTINSEYLEQAILRSSAKLVVLDPISAFIGGNVDVNNVASMRPINARIANLAQTYDCSFLIVSHTNKKPQADDANFAVTGSADTVNAARSAIKIIVNDARGHDKDREKIAVHTKSNHTRTGESVCFELFSVPFTDTENELNPDIPDEARFHTGARFCGFSEVTKETLEDAANAHKKPCTYLENITTEDACKADLIQVVKQIVHENPFGAFITSNEFIAKYGSGILGRFKYLKRALQQIDADLRRDGIEILYDKQQIDKSGHKRGFIFRKTPEN